MDLAARGLDDEWLVNTAIVMVDDLYKSYFRGFRWSRGVHDCIAATAGTVVQELHRRGVALHYVIDGTQPAARLDEMLTYVPVVFETAGLAVVSPQLAALACMEANQQSRDVAEIPRYRTEGHQIADEMTSELHRDRLSSVYLNLDFDDDTPGLVLDVALSATNTPGAIVVWRTLPPSIGSVVQVARPPELALRLNEPT